LRNFKVNEIFLNSKKLSRKSLFKYVNLEILYRSVVLGEKKYLPEILTNIGLRENYI
jgi:hypothetical protein